MKMATYAPENEESYTSMTIKNAKNMVILSIKVEYLDGSVFHIESPSWISLQIPHMWQTANSISGVISERENLTLSGYDLYDPIGYNDFLIFIQ